MSTFAKPPRTYAEQLQILESRGLEVTDRAFALHCLEHINYYRISAYRYTLLIPEVVGKPETADRFRPGTKFDELWKLYDLDNTLRRLVMDASKRVEVSVRSHWAYELAHKYGAFAYEKAAVFHDKARHPELLDDVDKELRRSKENFVTHFKEKHGLARPPIWAACEVCTFGMVSRFFSGLKFTSDRQKIANAYRMNERVLGSFLRHLTTVRNHAAHHGRIWNREFTVTMTPPRQPLELAGNFCYDPTTAERRIYNTLTMLLYMLSVIEPSCPIPRFLFQTIDRVGVIDQKHMGFPEDWRSRPLWRALA